MGKEWDNFNKLPEAEKKKIYRQYELCTQCFTREIDDKILEEILDTYKKAIEDLESMNELFLIIGALTYFEDINFYLQDHQRKKITKLRDIAMRKMDTINNDYHKLEEKINSQKNNKGVL